MGPFYFKETWPQPTSYFFVWLVMCINALPLYERGPTDDDAIGPLPLPPSRRMNADRNGYPSVWTAFIT
jgi:hypothetical protein